MPGAGLVAVRHAETVWNRQRVFMGARDVAPTAEGLARASVLGGTLRADLVLTSPLSRAARTAAALFPGAPVVRDVRLRERGMGEWEGRPKADVRREHPECFPGGHLDVTVTPPGGEDLAALFARVRALLAEIAPLAARSRVVLVSHNGWIRSAQCLAGDATIATFHAFPVPQVVPTPLRLPAGPAGG